MEKMLKRQAKLKPGFGSSFDLRRLDPGWRSKTELKIFDMDEYGIDEAFSKDFDKTASLPNQERRGRPLRRRHSFSSIEMMHNLLKETVSEFHIHLAWGLRYY